ncbi:MAG TPA: non-homologous end-joining DNA ligase [Candidatus Acidoferrales bacterium]|nr:non-homologous end-joining DNA ligase [Candidatus Acidoferrales bacterium]
MRTNSKADLVRVSNPDKVFWPQEHYTKLDLVNFYRDVFPALRPYVNDRILTLERCPNGMLGTCFYQKEKPAGMPPHTPTKTISSESAGRDIHYVVGGALATQLALANLGCIPVHVCGSRARTFPRPDWVCFDLDPESGRFADAANACLLLKQVLDALELVSFPKTSGSRGMHVFIPIRLGPTADEVLDFARDLARRLAASYPKQLTVETAIAARGDRVYLDVFRNGSVQTVASPYSVRRKPHAPVSTPLAWSEVRPSLDPARFNLGNFQARLSRKDPWAEFFRSRQTLRNAQSRLKAI